MFTLSVEFPWLYFTREQKEAPCVLSNHASKRREKCFVIWVLQVAKATCGQKKIQYIIWRKNQPKLARNKFKTWISSFSPSCFVWRKEPPFGTPQLTAGAGENFLKETSLAAQVSQHFALKGNFRGVLGIQPWQVPSPPVSGVIKLLSLQKAEFDCLFSSMIHPPRIH